MIEPLRLTESVKRDLKFLFIAKHALSEGALDVTDGNHAPYHYETRVILEGLFDQLKVANSYDVLFSDPGVDFVFPLLNRGGFFNSEMLCPLLCTRLGIPFLGANPILRGLADDKHLTKLEGRNRGVKTCDWAVYRAGAPVTDERLPKADRYVIKPNNSSASWGLSDAHDFAGVKAAVLGIHAEGHDAIVEPFMAGSDVEVPVIEMNGEPYVMPPMLFKQADPLHLRTHEEKRDLVDRSQKYELVPFEGSEAWAEIREMTLKMAEVFRPFDYGRFEFRFNEATGEVNLLEVNLQCNLWSQKVYGRSAVLMGWTQEDLIESICAESLRRHGLMDPGKT
ncbi:MAG: phosphoribosylglycinamide synthetase [Novosphingobium sp.]|nr:phosphoribosylglycinamide synthetase [Novosphingobium sp.]